MPLATPAAAQTTPPQPPLPPYLVRLPDFNPDIKSTLPGDIDRAKQQQLEHEHKFAFVQREFDLNAWQMFLALNWPVDESGNPKPALTDAGEARWRKWHTSSQVFTPDGTRPSFCNSGSSGGPRMLSVAPTDPMNVSISRGLPPFSKLSHKPPEGATTSRMTAAPEPDTGGPRLLLGTISSVGELNVATLSEINQAFSGPLIDQNGQLVFYDIRIDPNEVGYLCENTLYNINGQVSFSDATKRDPNKKVMMPSGTQGTDASGAFELKLAWKILTLGKDDFSRFYNVSATVADIDDSGNIVLRNVTVGLVGMHIAHKSDSSPQWIWATFEQVDNLEVDQVANPKLQPSFTNPNCESCAVNLPVRTLGTGALDRTPTQVWRAIPIPADKTALNIQARAALSKLGSVFRYYQLIDTQWPTVPKAPPTPPSGGPPGAVNNKSGGNPTPVFLTNATMETFFQHGNQRACEQEEGQCPAGSSAATDPTPKQVFGTESCMGCHSSAGIYTSYDPRSGTSTTSGQLTADFSWLPAQKAAWCASANPEICGKK